MQIILADKYRLYTEKGARQIIIQRKKTINPSKSPWHKEGEPYTIREEWQDWRFPNGLAHALDICAQQELYNSEATSLDELADEMRSFRAYIDEAMRAS